MAGALTKKCGRMPALGWWLMAVGTFRSGLTFWACFFCTVSHCSATIVSKTYQMTDVDGRTVAVWTLLSSTLCFLCAFNLSSKPLYAATFLSFVYGIVYVSVECFVYHTMRADRIVPYIFIAVTSMVWMLLQWNSNGHGSPPRRATSKQP